MDEHDTEAQLRTLLQETPEQSLWSEEAVADIMAAGTRGRRRRAVVAWAASAAAFALVVAGGTVAWQLRPDPSLDGSMLSVGADATRSPEVAVADVFPEASELGGALSYEGDPAGLRERPSHRSRVARPATPRSSTLLEVSSCPCPRNNCGRPSGAPPPRRPIPPPSPCRPGRTNGGGRNWSPIPERVAGYPIRPLLGQVAMAPTGCSSS